jgi:hypothetical protein
MYTQWRVLMYDYSSVYTVHQTRRGYLTTAAALTGIAVAGCSDVEDNGDDGESGDADDGSDGSSADLELLDHQAVREDEGTDFESLAVEGTARNTSGGELSYAEVEVKFYAGDTLDDSFLDNVNNLGDGEEWNFEVQYPSFGSDAAEITEYEIEAGTSL